MSTDDEDTAEIPPGRSSDTEAVLAAIRQVRRLLEAKIVQSGAQIETAIEGVRQAIQDHRRRLDEHDRRHAGHDKRHDAAEARLAALEAAQKEK